MRNLQFLCYGAIAFLLVSEINIAPGSNATGNQFSINQAAYARGGGGGGRSSSSSSSSRSSSSSSSSRSSSSYSSSNSSSSSSSRSSRPVSQSRSPQKPSSSVGTTFRTPQDSRGANRSVLNATPASNHPANSAVPLTGAVPNGGNTGGRVRAGSLAKPLAPQIAAPSRGPQGQQQRSPSHTIVIERTVQTVPYPYHPGYSTPIYPSSSQPANLPSNNLAPTATPNNPNNSVSETPIPSLCNSQNPNNSVGETPISSPCESQNPNNSVSETPRGFSPASRNAEDSPSNPPSSSPSAFQGYWLWFWIFLGIAGTIWLVYWIYSQQQKASSTGVDELNHDMITVSKLQVALLATTGNLQGQLTELSLNADVETAEGRAEFLQECALLLLRSPEKWTHALASSQTVKNREAAAVIFNQLSVQERSKFSLETFANVNGQIRWREPISQVDEGPAAYLVVTFLMGTEDDRSLFGNIRNSQELRVALEQIASLPAKYLLIFELIWSPQKEIESLSYEKLLTAYADLIPI